MARPTHRRMKPEIRAIVEWAAEHGWKVQDQKDGNDHWVLRHPTDGTVRLPDTPGEYRGFANAKAEIRRKSGLPNDSGPAARYRHEPRRERFSMDVALAEQRARRAREEADALIRRRIARWKEVLREINPRRDPGRAREVAETITALQRQLNRDRVDDHEQVQGVPRRAGERDDLQAPEA